MSEKEHLYRGDGITVRYDLKRCIHAAECVRNLPRVFDPRRRPWVEPDAAAADDVAAVVMRCPTGALHFERSDGGAAEPTPAVNTVTVVPEGPLYLRGDLEVVDATGTAIRRDTRLALCRCGASRNKPYCDNSHLRAGFDDDGRLAEGCLADGAATAGGPLRIRPQPDGPLLVDGPVEVLGGGDRGAPATQPLALCRCGASARKPSCDGSHERVGFSAD